MEVTVAPGVMRGAGGQSAREPRVWVTYGVAAQRRHRWHASSLFPGVPAVTMETH